MTALFIIALVAEIVLAFIAIRADCTPLCWSIGYAIPVTVMVFVALSVLM